MSKTRRIFTIIKSLILLLLAAAILIDPESGYMILLLIMELWLLFSGIKQMIYYFSMAKYKVGGLTTLYKSILIIDVSLLFLGMNNAPRKLIMIVLAFSLAFNGVVYIMKAMKSKKLESATWKSQLIRGILMFLVAIVCIIFINSTRIAAVVYGLSLIAVAVSDIIDATRRTAIIYIG